MSVKEKVKEVIGKIALNESRPTKEKTKNARRQANEAKIILKRNLKKRKDFFEKVTIKKN